MNPTKRRILYIAVAWVLLVCYSILLASAAESIIDFLGNIVTLDYNARSITIFLYSLAVVSFLGGSQIPAVFLKKKSFIVQFAFSATFGLILLVITIFNEPILKPFFSNYPIVALEYLSIPYLFMIFIDFHSSERLGAFSWRHLGQFLRGPFLHPRRTFEEVMYHRSILFSFVSAVLVSIAWIVRTAVFSSIDFVPARWRFVPLNIIGESVDIFFKIFGEDVHLVVITLIIPMVLFSWVIVSVLVHIVARKIGGNGSYSRTASVLGFAFLPSLITIAFDLLEIGFQIENLLVLDVIFLILGFVIPLVLWPLILVTFAVQTSENLSSRGASLTAITVFLPLFILLTGVFL